MDKQKYRFFVKTATGENFQGFVSQELTETEAAKVIKKVLDLNKSGNLDFFNLKTDDGKIIFINFKQIVWFSFSPINTDFSKYVFD